jgi:secreted PhoX family phosphatase
MSVVDDDIISNVSSNPTFEQVLQARVSRRSVLGGGVTGAAAAVSASLGGVGALLSAVPAEANGGRRPRLGFEGIPPAAWTTPGPVGGGEFDKIVVPQGYTAEVLIAWGDPVSNGPAFDNTASQTFAAQEQQWGMHNDGLVYFPLLGSRHGLIVQNHEYTDDVLLFNDGTAGWNADKTKKSLAAHGVGIIEVRKRHGKWTVVRPSFFARRITGYTPIRIAGPAAGHDLLKTSADATGKRVLGTLNNCAMGYTPWGSYLACEENFNGYFRQPGTQSDLERRYGINAAGFGYLWHTTDERFDTSQEPNEPNRFGWVTEIYPYMPYSTPVKRTALGRFKHEGAWVQEARDGRVVVYSGDDEQFEYIYRYVSKYRWKESFVRGVHPLDEGTLYVAKFDSSGTGEWLPLTPDNPALSHLTLAEILINTRSAADLVGATKMDRPEWIDTFPDKLTAIATLTNNSRRGAATPPTAPVDAANPRAPNTYGHVIQWSYYNDWTEPTFYWEIFALCGDPAVVAHGSTIIGDKYGSPDGIYVDPSGLLWIQTDVSGGSINVGSYAGFGNNQMLAADPETRETRRFLTGPNVCEITGVFMTPDRSTMFVGVQHPGEAPSGVNDPTNPKRYSDWPDGSAGARPRSSLIVITKDDGGVIGS